MKTYTKPQIEIVAFRADGDIAANSIFDYNDNNSVPVSLFQIEESSWNGSSAS